MNTINSLYAFIHSFTHTTIQIYPWCVWVHIHSDFTLEPLMLPEPRGDWMIDCNSVCCDSFNRFIYAYQISTWGCKTTPIERKWLNLMIVLRFRRWSGYLEHRSLDVQSQFVHMLLDSMVHNVQTRSNYIQHMILFGLLYCHHLVACKIFPFNVCTIFSPLSKCCKYKYLWSIVLVLGGMGVISLHW